MSDRILELLADLPEGQPDARRAERVKLRCHAALARRQRAPRRRRHGARFWEPAVAGLAVAYLTEVVRQALRFYGAR
jgi:hypothetical protein